MNQKIIIDQEHKKYMGMALEEAEKAFAKGEIPIGAVIIKEGRILAKAHNQVEEKGSTLFHAEMIAIKEACREMNNKYLEGCTLYVTLEPCVMCAGAIINSRVQRVVFGADELKTGCAGSVLNLLHFPGFHPFVHITPNIMQDESLILLQKFFREKR